MNHTTIAIRIIIATALAASMLVAGTNLGILQQQSHAASQTKQQEQKTVQDLRGNLAKRSTTRQQHMDEENLCLRDSKCNNSNVGEQTLGNDNSVTGFADQSKNIQATPTVTPTPTPTPIPSQCPKDTVFDLMLQGTLASGSVTLPRGTMLCLNATGAVLAEITPDGTVLTVTNVIIIGFSGTNPITGLPVCGLGSERSVLASGTVPPALLNVGNFEQITTFGGCATFAPPGV